MTFHRRKMHRPEQIVAKLRDVLASECRGGPGGEAEASEGLRDSKAIAATCKKAIATEAP